jgi:hypothetical protein
LEYYCAAQHAKADIQITDRQNGVKMTENVKWRKMTENGKWRQNDGKCKMASK